MPFDPNQPFEPVDDKPAFDPQQPYEAVAVADFDPTQPFEAVDDELTSEQVAGYGAQLQEAATGFGSPIGATARLGAGLGLPSTRITLPQTYTLPKEATNEEVLAKATEISGRGNALTYRRPESGEHIFEEQSQENIEAGRERAIQEAVDIDKPLITLPKPESEALAGVAQAEAVLESFVTKRNAALMLALPGAPALIQKAVSAYFAGSMGKAALEKIPDVADAIQKGELTEAGKGLVEFGANLLPATGAGAHSAGVRPKGGRIVEMEATRMAQDFKEAAETPVAAPVTGEMYADSQLRELQSPKAENAESGLPEGFVSVGASTGADIAAPGKIGGYNADVEARQKARGQTPTISEARKEDPVTWENAMGAIEKDPAAPEKLVKRIQKDPKKPLTDEEQQMLTWRRGDLENRMAQEAERAIDPNLSPDEQAVHQSNAELLESQLLSTEQANRIAGTASGRSLRSRQLEMNDDFTFAGLMMRQRKLTGEVVPPDVRAQIKAQADEIAALRKNAEKTDAIEAEAKHQTEVVATHEATIANLLKAEKARPTYGKPILDRAEKIVARLETKAIESDAYIRNALGKTNIAADPALLYHVGVSLAAKIGRFGLDKTEAFARMVTEYGEAVRPYLEDGWKKAHTIIGSSGGGDVRNIVKLGVSKPVKGEKTSTDATNRIKAEAAAQTTPSHKAVYELVRSLLNEGVKEPDALKRAHEIIVESHPGTTLRDVGNAFVDYGKIKYPNSEQVATTMRHLRQITKIGEDITRIEEGLTGKIDPETGKPTREKKIGMQRDKADQQIRDLQKKRNDLLKLVPQDTSAATLASRDTAKQTALRNAIEDLDSKLRGKEQVKRTAGQPDSPETAQLRAELEAMRELDREIEAAKNPPLSDAQKALDAALVARERAGQTLDDISTGKTKPAALTKEALTQLEEDVRLETDALKKLAAEMRRDAKKPGDPEYARDQARIKALERAIDTYSKRTADLDFSSPPKVHGPDTARVAALKGIRDSRRAAYEAAKKAGRTVLSPEQRYNATRAKGIERQIKEAEARLKEGKFAPRPKKVQPALTRANLDAKAKLEAKKVEIREGEEKYRLANRTGLQKAKERSLLALQSVRGIVLGSDVGVLTRQGLFAWARPVKAIQATSAAFKAAFSPESMARWEIEIRDLEINGEPILPKQKAAGLSTTDRLTHPEELVVTRLLSRIPDFTVAGKTVKLSVVGRTLERFQTTFINDIRVKTFATGVKAGMSDLELKRLAHFINNATGRGNIKYVPRTLSVLMTSPRYEFSRWGMLLEPIHNIGALARGGVKGELNKAALSNLKDMAVVVAGIYGLFKLAENSGYSISWDPESSDFLKMRKGDEAWDVSAGLAPRLRDVLRIYVAWNHPTYQKNIGKTLLNAGLRTINPAIKTAVDQTSVAEQRLTGVIKPVLPLSGFRSDEEREGLITLAPLIVQSMNESLADGPGQAAFTAAREFVGSSVNRYPQPKE